ncbi:hypothetical protein CAPTEDRAFT_190862 [Capitella teleta]|uniref:Uncharacterized protein n=1 Tax=Capitella teleta TaxID=283909 RepID=R7V3Y9_CAPTE|nr:hypothetical protein CAPTEDRAFT_190862 [Capitella teleta]|eukprot:ELU10525.1 hypothetical protein CAPTEDRAFT_190862 [Capitella teleta]
MADNLGNLPRIPSLKRSWADFQAVDDPETGSSDVETPSCPPQAFKRSRESSTDVQGNDTGYASSLSEAPDPAPPGECENSLPALQPADSTYHSDSRDSGSRTEANRGFLKGLYTVLKA